MTIKRTHKSFQKNFLKKNNHLKILDLGCTHVNYWKEANHFADIVDYSKEFLEKNLKFTLLHTDQKLPFKDKEFDYVILSHVLEHVPNISEFTKEGCSVIVASNEIPELINNCNRIITMQKGLISNIFNYEDFNEQKISLNISLKYQPS